MTMQIERQGPAAAPRRARRRSARASSSRATSSSTSARARRRRRSSSDGDTIPINQTATPVQLDQVLTALQSPTRATTSRRCCASTRPALDERRRQGLQPLDPVLEAGLPRLGDRRDALLGEPSSTTSPATSRTRARPPPRSTATPSQLKSLITDFNTTAAAFAAPDTSTSRPRRRAAATRCAPAEPALGRSTRRSRRCAGSSATLRPGVRSSRPDARRRRPVRRASCAASSSEPELRGLPPTCARRCRRWRASTQRPCRCNEQVRRSSSCQNEVVLPWTQRHGRRTSSSRRTGRSTEEAAEAAPGPRRREPLGRRQRPVVPRAGRRRHEPRRRSAPACSPRTATPILGVNPPKPQRKRPPLRPDVPCETQQTPDLRTTRATPPEQHQLDTTRGLPGPLAKPRAGQAVDWLQHAAQDRGPATSSRSPTRTPRQSCSTSSTEAARTRDPQAPRDFAAISALRRSRPASSRLHPRPAAAALPVVQAQAVRAQRRVRHRAGRHRRARARPCASPACAIGDIGDVELKDGHAVVHDGHRPAVQGPDPHRRDRAAAARRPGLKDMFIELDPGTGRRAGRAARAGRSRSTNDGAGRQPRRGPLRRSTPTRATTCSC